MIAFKQTNNFKRGGGEKVIDGWINSPPLHCDITPLREGMQVTVLQ